MSVRVVGDPIALALAGLPEPAGEPELVVALDDAPGPANVRWWRGRPERGATGERTIATDGEGLWSRAPWPVRDELFDLAAPAAPGRVLLVGAEDDDVAFACDHGLDVEAVGRLTAEALAAADVVVHGIGLGAPLPGDALAVLAAGRLLVTNAAPGFGLRAGVDHLAAEGIAPAYEVIQEALAAPEAFAALRRMGRLTAREHRASEVYARL